MAILVLGPQNSGGGPPAPQLWKFIGGGDNDIEMNTGVGVTGMDAVNPTDANVRMKMNSASPAELLADDGVNLSSIGFAKVGGRYLPLLTFLQHASNVFARMGADIDIAGLENGFENDFTPLGGNLLEMKITTDTLMSFKINHVVAFGIDDNGHLWFSNVVAAPPAGVSVKKIPAYDNTGTFLGYIPIYPL
jgi:hypothetical protein